jgi:hypothetical protein
MKFHEQNGWFYGREFMRACQAVSNMAGSLSFMEADLWRCKYVQIYVDQRTGSFIFRDGAGVMLTHDEVYAMFPELKDEWPSDIPDDGPVDL